MKLSVRLTLLVAAPIEIINFWLFSHFSIRNGLPTNASGLMTPIYYQSLFMHFPGLVFLLWLGRQCKPLQDSAFVAGLLIGGYIDTVLLILALAWVVRFIGSARHKRSVST